MSKEQKAQAPKEQVVHLYEGGKRIHPKLAKGRFANWRIFAIVATQFVFYVLPWFNWSGRQAVLFDIPERHFYIFGLSLGMGDLIYLAGLLIICAFGLFWWTTIAGRLWCGYACPQTVYTEIMLWIDHFIEGDRNKRLKLDKSPWNFTKIRIKATKYLLIFAVCAWTGITFAGWFTPIREFVPAIFNFTAGGGALFAAAFYGFMTFLFAHIMREQVCKYMCPYARFQSAMFDRDTLVVTYDPVRGDPRGPRSRKADPAALGLGSCVDCGLCVQVCPTGIDIREGLQYECISCAACIDVCDGVMDNMGYARGLIRNTTQNGLEGKWSQAQMWRRVLRPRVLLYSAVLLALCIGLLASLVTRTPPKVAVVRDRAALSRIVAGGKLENVYRLQIMNATESEQNYRIRARGLDGLEVGSESEFVVGPAESRWVPVRLQIPYGSASPGSHPVVIEIEATQGGAHVAEKSVFIVPR